MPKTKVIFESEDDFFRRLYKLILDINSDPVNIAYIRIAVRRHFVCNLDTFCRSMFNEEPEETLMRMTDYFTHEFNTSMSMWYFKAKPTKEVFDGFKARARHLFNHNNFEGALKIYQNMERLFPNYKGIYHNLAAIFLKLERYDKATEYVLKGSHEYNPVALYYLAESAAESGRWPEIASLFEGMFFHIFKKHGFANTFKVRHYLYVARCYKGLCNDKNMTKRSVDRCFAYFKDQFENDNWQIFVNTYNIGELLD